MIFKTFIIKSNSDEYIENKIKKINVKENIGEGSYGVVFLIQNEHVIKIFKNSTLHNTILDESNYLIPIKNENRDCSKSFR
jgi:predicted Ser/Thr protein kinase